MKFTCRETRNVESALALAQGKNHCSRSWCCYGWLGSGTVVDTYKYIYVYMYKSNIALHCSWL